MTNTLIKIANPDEAKFLVSLGFQYMKEQDVFVFHSSEELMAVLQRHYAGAPYVTENKLRF